MRKSLVIKKIYKNSAASRLLNGEKLDVSLLRWGWSKASPLTTVLNIALESLPSQIREEKGIEGRKVGKGDTGVDF